MEAGKQATKSVVKPKPVEIGEIKISTAVFAKQAEEMRVRLNEMKMKLKRQNLESRKRIESVAAGARAKIENIKRKTEKLKVDIKEEELLKEKAVPQNKGVSFFQKIGDWLKGLLIFIKKIFSKIFGK